MVVHCSAKLVELEVYVVLYNYNFICLSEAYLDSSVGKSNEEIKLDGYNLIRSS